MMHPDTKTGDHVIIGGSARERVTDHGPEHIRALGMWFCRSDGVSVGYCRYGEGNDGTRVAPSGLIATPDEQCKFSADVARKLEVLP